MPPKVRQAVDGKGIDVTKTTRLLWDYLPPEAFPSCDSRGMPASVKKQYFWRKPFPCSPAAETALQPLTFQ